MLRPLGGQCSAYILVPYGRSAEFFFYRGSSLAAHPGFTVPLLLASGALAVARRTHTTTHRPSDDACGHVTSRHVTSRHLPDEVPDHFLPCLIAPKARPGSPHRRASRPLQRDASRRRDNASRENPLSPPVLFRETPPPFFSL